MIDKINTSAGTKAWEKRVDVITLFAEDLEQTKKFYQEVFGLPVHFEDPNSAVFKLDNLMINLLKLSEANGLIQPARAAMRESGNRFVFTMTVDDVDKVCAELAQRGVELLNGPMDRPWGVRTASFMDPAGHIWEIAK